MEEATAVAENVNNNNAFLKSTPFDKVVVNIGSFTKIDSIMPPKTSSPPKEADKGKKAANHKKPGSPRVGDASMAPVKLKKCRRILKRHPLSKMLRLTFTGPYYEARLELAIREARKNEKSLNDQNLKVALSRMKELKRQFEAENNEIHETTPQHCDLIDLEPPPSEMNIPLGKRKEEKIDAVEINFAKNNITPKYTLLSYILNPEQWENLKDKRKKLYSIGPFVPPRVKIESNSDEDFQPATKKQPLPTSDRKDLKKSKKKSSTKRRNLPESKKKELLTSPKKN